MSADARQCEAGVTTWKFCDQCGDEVGYIERLVAQDPHGIDYYRLECEQCEAALEFVAVEVEPTGPVSVTPPEQAGDDA